MAEGLRVAAIAGGVSTRVGGVITGEATGVTADARVGVLVASGVTMPNGVGELASVVPLLKADRLLGETVGVAAATGAECDRPCGDAGELGDMINPATHPLIDARAKPTVAARGSKRRRNVQPYVAAMPKTIQLAKKRAPPHVPVAARTPLKTMRIT
jgi:hypothetical protein